MSNEQSFKILIHAPANDLLREQLKWCASLDLSWELFICIVNQINAPFFDDNEDALDDIMDV